jgi:putative transposase
MKTSRFSEAQIIGILKQAEDSVPVSQPLPGHGMIDARFYQWRAKYGGMDASLIFEMKPLEDENKRRGHFREKRGPSMRIRPHKRILRERPETLAVPLRRGRWIDSDQLVGGRSFRALNGMDDFNREGCPAPRLLMLPFS